MAQWNAKDLKYPIYSGQSYADSSSFHTFNFSINGKQFEQTIEFKPYQSILLKVSSNKVEELDIEFIPKDPSIRTREPQKMYF